MNKAEVLQKLERYPDDAIFPDDLFRNVWTPRRDEPHTIRFNLTELEMAKCPVQAFEILEVARERGLCRPDEVILVEELPNGTSQIIGQYEQIRLRDFMNFSAISR